MSRHAAAALELCPPRRSEFAPQSRPVQEGYGAGRRRQVEIIKSNTGNASASQIIITLKSLEKQESKNRTTT